MAASAFRAQARECAFRRPGVAGLARGRCMGSEKGKTVLVISDVLHGSRPPSHRVALLALQAKLETVDISMAVGAVGSHIAKRRLDMAAGASYVLVHAAQREARRAVVIELRLGPDGLPTHRSVTVFAGDADGTVGIRRPDVLGALSNQGFRPKQEATRHG